MKRKIYKVMAVALTVTLLVSLMMGLAAVPAAADPGANKWTEFKKPKAGSDGDYFMSELITALGPMDKAIDGTLWVAAMYEGAAELFKSADGREWDKTDYQKDVSGGTIVDIVCSSMDADIVYVTDGTNVFWTEDADNFETLAAPPVDTGTIKCMDVGYIDDIPYIFVGTIGDSAPINSDDDVWVAEQAGFGLTWEQLLIMTDRATAYAEVDIFDVAVGLDFDSEQAVIAIVRALTTGTGAHDGTFRTCMFGGSQWAATKGDAELKYGAVSPVAFPLDPAGDATIWMPDDFDSDDMELFVGLDDDGGLGGDVYWLIGTTVYDLDIVATYGEADVTDLHGAGGVGDTSMIAATDGGDMRYSTDNGDSWSKNKKKPTGDGDAFVRVATDFLDSEEAWAAVSGTDAAVSFTRDSGSLWNGIGLISTDMDCIIDIELTPDWGSSGALFVVTNDTADTSFPKYDGESLWKYDGDNWERIFHRSLMDTDVSTVYISDVEVSPEWASDECVMFGDRYNSRHYSSTDGGGRFRRGNSAVPAGVENWLLIDASTILAGATDGKIYRTTNNGTTWSGKSTDTGVATYFLALDPNNPDNILAGCDNGKVYLSEDGGGSWDSKGTVEDSTNIPIPAFDPDYANNDTFYAALHGDDTVYRRSDTVWDDISGLTGTWQEDIGGAASVDPVGGYNMVVGPDGVLYVVDGTSSTTAVARCSNAETGGTSGDNACYFENITKDWDGGYAWGLWLAPGSNELWTINITLAEIWAYTDEVTTPKLSTPSDGTSSERIDEVTVKWNAVTNATKYVIFWDTDSGFANYEHETTGNTSYRITGLEDGQTYYWKVAVYPGKPVVSLWSDKWKFTTALSAAQWNPFVGGVPEAPYNGATNVPLTPTFAWNAADWATGYAFELAKDAGFTDKVVSKTGANALSGTVYLCEQALANSTTYYWRVQAVGKTTQSDWATGVFTTEGKAPAPPAPPPPPAPPAPLPPTPTYIWVIIGVGALLAIAVIVLIVRTRRPA